MKPSNSQKIITYVILLVALLPTICLADGWSPTSQASNLGSVVNTRHNLTTDYSKPFWRSTYWQPGMQDYVLGYPSTSSGRWNYYGEVCVYCHTPHNASTTLKRPLWNRAQKGDTQYWRYGTTSSGQTAQTQYGDFPWPALAGRTRRMNDDSMTCLSCHDGTIGMDGMLNMPGSGGYSNVGEFVNGVNNIAALNTFLSTWKNPNGLSTNHLNMSGCSGCHKLGNIGERQIFDGFLIAPYNGGSLELRDDHPIAIPLPNSLVDFKAPTQIKGNLSFYDLNMDGRPDPNEIRYYDYGDGKRSVECSSCHDPHGVRTGGPGSSLVPGFLRVSNTGSGLCLTCHTK